MTFDVVVDHEKLRLECLKIAADKCGQYGPESTVIAASKLLAFVLGPEVKVKDELKQAGVNHTALNQFAAGLVYNNTASAQGQGAASQAAEQFGQAPQPKPALSEAARTALGAKLTRLRIESEDLRIASKMQADEMQRVQRERQRTALELAAIEADLGLGA